MFEGKIQKQIKIRKGDGLYLVLKYILNCIHHFAEKFISEKLVTKKINAYIESLPARTKKKHKCKNGKHSSKKLIFWKFF